MTRLLTVVFLSFTLFLGACTTTGTDRSVNANDSRNMGETLATPVADLGLDRIEIPTYLENLDDPYALPPTSCALARAEIETLDTLLGSDLDITEDEDERQERLRMKAAGSAFSSLVLPFRGLVRTVSGASANEREAREAYQRGLVRRGFVKGLAYRMDCDL